MSYGGYHDPWAEDDDTAQEDSVVKRQREAKSATIMLVDARKSMFVPMDGGEIPFNCALRVVMENLKDKIICSEQDLVGVFFLGTKEKDAQSSFENVNKFIEMGPPTATGIRALQAIIEGETDFEAEYGSLENKFPLPLFHGIWSCAMEFAGKKLQPHDFKSISIFTNDDDPFNGEKQKEEQCIQKAKDGAEEGQEFQLWNLGKTFNSNKFYTKMLPIEEDADTGIVAGGSGGFDDLLERVRRKQFKKRVLSRCRLSIGKDISFAVGLYAMVMPMSKPSPAWLEARTNAPLTCQTKWVCDDTGSYLMTHQIKSFMPYGGARVFLSKEELASIKNLGVDGLQLVGFKPMSALKMHHNLRSSYFVYPDELAVKGSKVALNALRLEMIRAKKIAVGFFSISKRAPKMVALVAEKEEVDEDGYQFRAPGFSVIVLPYADDIRQYKPKEMTVAPVNDLVVKAQAVIGKLNLPDFDCHSFENPTLQKHYATLQALALDEAEITWKQDTDDTIQPDTAGMMDFKDELKDFADAFGGSALAAVTKAPTKRKAAGDSKPRAKRVKKEVDVYALDWAAMASSGKVKKQNMTTLKAFLKSKGLKVSGKKADLVERVENFFS